MICVVTGFVAGLLHVVSGPDHLAAVAPLAVNGRGRPWVPGLKWGLGHASGVVAVGVLSLMLREILPLGLISSWSERLVGVMLLAIGLWGLRRAFTARVHVHEHSHGGRNHIHVHLHAHRARNLHTHADGSSHSHTHAAFAIGTLHGLAGSSHFLGVLPALAFPSVAEAAGYLAAYGVGSIGAMAAFSSVMGILAARCDMGGTRAYRGLLCVCSGAAMGIGGYWLIG